MLVRIILTTVTYLLHISLEFVVNTTVSDDIILQWGMTGFTNAGGFSDVNFPISFNKVFSIVSLDGGNIGVIWGVIRSSVSGTGVTFTTKKHDGTVMDKNEGYYIAIGQS